MKKFFLMGVLGVLFSGCESEVPPRSVRPVRALQLHEESLVDLHAFPGRTRAVGRANLSFRVEGPLIERPVFVGDVVQKGDLLARIDPKDFEITIEEVEGKLEMAKAQERFASRDYERALNIWKEDPGAISESLLDKKKEEANEFKGEVRSLEAQLEGAEDQLAYTRLLAPYPGMVVATYVENFEYVLAKQPIIRLLNTSQVEMVIDVPESLITSIPFVEKAEVQFDTYPNLIFEAKIKEIGTEASKTTRTYPVTLVIDQPEEAVLLSGMAGHAYLYSTKTDEFSQQGFLVPTTALLTGTDDKKTQVFIYEPTTNRVALREVTKGKLLNNGILITEGLSAGQWVVTSGVHHLQEGQEAALWPVVLNAQGQQVDASDH